MPYTLLSDDHFDKEKVAVLSDSAVLLDIRCICYCNRILSDGRLHPKMLDRITSSTTTEQDIAELIEVGLWTLLDDGAYQLDWSGQEKKEQVLKRREAQRVRTERSRNRSALHNNGDHSECDPGRCWVLRGRKGNTVTPGVTDGVSNKPSPTPRPAPEEGGAEEMGADARSAGATRAERPDEESRHFYVANAIQTACRVCAEPEKDPVHFNSSDECPHKKNGLQWDGDDWLKCVTCYRFVNPAGNESKGIPGHTAKGHVGLIQKRWPPIKPRLTPEHWTEMGSYEPDAHALATLLAQRLYGRFGDIAADGSVADPDTYGILVRDTYWRMTGAA